MGSEPDFPPLLRGEATSDKPLEVAVRRAREGTDAGLVVHNVRPEHLSAAIVLGPEVPLSDAMAMVLAAANAFGDAFGALAPPEIAAEFDWPGGIRINGARCGGFRAAASTADPVEEPDWLVIAIDLPFFEPSAAEPGMEPDRTTLCEEGCSEILPARLLESWSRHLLVWINEWTDNGIARLHRDYSGRMAAAGADAAPGLPHGISGRIIGLDDKGGLLIRLEDEVRLLPLTTMLEDPC